MLRGYWRTKDRSIDYVGTCLDPRPGNDGTECYFHSDRNQGDPDAIYEALKVALEAE